VCVCIDACSFVCAHLNVRVRMRVSVRVRVCLRSLVARSREALAARIDYVFVSCV